MFRSIVCGFLFVSLAAGAAVPEVKQPPSNIKAEVILIKDASKLKELQQRAELIPIERVETRGQIRYTLGNRVSNDSLVSQYSDSYQWAVAQDVQLRLQYPSNGTGAVLTAVEIIVNQSSNVGRAYVVAGGIGQRNIVIVVEAYNTYWLDYVSKFYGIEI